MKRREKACAETASPSRLRGRQPPSCIDESASLLAEQTSCTSLSTLESATAGGQKGEKAEKSSRSSELASRQVFGSVHSRGIVQKRGPNCAAIGTEEIPTAPRHATNRNNGKIEEALYQGPGREKTRLAIFLSHVRFE